MLYAYGPVCFFGFFVFLAGIGVFGVLNFLVFSGSFEALLGGGLFWFFALLPFVFGLVVLVVVCYFRADSEWRTRRRGIVVDLACREVNELLLNGSDLRVQAGDYAAWLEVRILTNAAVQSKNEFLKILRGFWDYEAVFGLSLSPFVTVYLSFSIFWLF